MSDRGMKKWGAFKALTEQFDDLEDKFSDDKPVERPILSEDKIEEINAILTQYHGQNLIIKEYVNQRIKQHKCIINKIDINNKKLVISSGETIKLLDIVDIVDLD